MTELAYLADPAAAYVRAFRARIRALPPGGIVLDRTFFYPTGGGQPADRGTVRTAGGEEIEVANVTKSGTSVIHWVRGSPTALRGLRLGEEVEGTLDWARRHRHMRLHTGQHLLSARVFARTGRRTRRANLGGIEATLELEGPLPADSLGPLADDLREAVDHPRSVMIRYLPRSEWDRNPFAGRSGLVPLPIQVDPVRVVEIDATDVCPCGGTHLGSTVELGAVTLGTVGGRGDTRITLTLVDAGPTTPKP